ncbi:MAG TPA: hypothetical protein VGL99_28760 [Chloroflexota bacterium]
MRLSADLLAAHYAMDARDVLSSIQASALVLQRRDDVVVNSAVGVYLAERLHERRFASSKASTTCRSSATRAQSSTPSTPSSSRSTSKSRYTGPLSARVHWAQNRDAWPAAATPRRGVGQRGVATRAELPPGRDGLKALLGMFRVGFPDYRDGLMQRLTAADIVGA